MWDGDFLVLLIEYGYFMIPKHSNMIAANLTIKLYNEQLMKHSMSFMNTSFVGYSRPHVYSMFHTKG